MWATTIVFDADRDDVGTATATWTQGNETFVYSRRLSTDEFDAFAIEAMTALDEHRDRIAKYEEVTVVLAAQFEASAVAYPKVKAARLAEEAKVAEEAKAEKAKAVAAAAEKVAAGAGNPVPFAVVEEAKS